MSESRLGAKDDLLSIYIANGAAVFSGNCHITDNDYTLKVPSFNMNFIQRMKWLVLGK